VFVVADYERGEAVAEEVAAAGVALVEGLRVGAVQPVQAAREAFEQRLDDDVVVVGHQAEGVAGPVGAPHDLGQHREKKAAVVFVTRDRATGNPADSDVIDALGGEHVAR
jgi:hypothetical protein